MAQIGVEWFGIVGAVWACHRFFIWPVYVVTVIWIGARQHALAVLMHDAAHHRLWPARRVNDLLGDLVVAWPLFLSVASYRAIHLAHHRHLNTPADPDWVSLNKLFEYRFPKPAWQIVLVFVATVLGFGAFRQVHALLFYNRQAAPHEGDSPSLPRQTAPLGRLLFYFAVAAALVWGRAVPLFVGYWLIPVFTWGRWVVYLRAVAEHVGLRPGDSLSMTRTVLPSAMGRMLVAPNNVHYHVEHHLYPSVPFYNLPALHRVLLRDPAFRDRILLARSYRAVLRDLTVRRDERRR